VTESAGDGADRRHFLSPKKGAVMFVFVIVWAVMLLPSVLLVIKFFIDYRRVSR